MSDASEVKAPEDDREGLRSQVKELQAANEELSQFTGAVAHDLRNPLTEVLCCAGLLLSLPTVASNPAALDLANQVLRGAGKMRALIDDYLAFYRVEAQVLKRERVSLEALVDIVRQELEPQTKNREIAWHVGRLPEALGDASMLRQALANLLGNAIKFTSNRPEARIEVGAYASGQEIVVFVQDNGIGFHMEDAGKLFKKFQRLHKKDNFPGSGVGLVIVRNIIHRHGGRIWAESTPGKGSTFYFTLPDGGA